MDNEINIKKSCFEKIYLYIFFIFVKIHSWFDVRKAQEFEYIFAHFLDKNFESFFNFLHVLPGAWSAYRYEAISKSFKNKDNILQKYYLKMALNPNMV